MHTLFSLPRTAYLIFRLMTDRRVPGVLRLLVPVALVYALLPFDAIPDVFPGMGWLDDIAVLLIAIMLLLKLAPRSVVREHYGGVDKTVKRFKRVIDGRFRYKSE